MKKGLIIGCSLLICGVISAQKAEHYFFVNVGGGMHELSYQLANGTKKGLIGATANVGYSHFFSSKWGLQTGLGIHSYGTLATINDITKTPDIDSDGDAYELNIKYKNWQEKQTMLSLDLPLTLQYRRMIKPKVILLAAIGTKMSISIPSTATYQTTGGEIERTGYYSQWDVELHDLPQHNFTTITTRFTESIDLKPTYMLTAELGNLFEGPKKLDVYVGAYLDYGLNNIINPGNKLIYQADGTYNGVLESQQTDNVKLLSFGIKIGLYLRLDKKSPCRCESYR
jgi:hypothetical protein